MSKNFEVPPQQLVQAQGLAPAGEECANPSLPGGGKDGFARIAQFDLESATAKDYLRFAGRLALGWGEESHVIIAFAGVEYGVTASKFCVRFSEALAALPRTSVCLVDAYWHSPLLSEIFDLGRPCGLTDALHMGGGIKDFTVPVGVGNLWLLSWGSFGTESIALLDQETMAKRFAELRAEFEFVLVNVPPLGPSADALAMLCLVDGVVPVIERGAGEPRVALRVTEELRAARVRVLGAIVAERAKRSPD